jgi:hypothetical protein
MDAYNTGRESNVEFYCEASSFQYDKVLHPHQDYMDTSLF